VIQDGPQLEERLSELQAQVDRLSLSLQVWRHSDDHLQPMERRLSQLTERCVEMLDAWKTLSERHAHAVGELESRLNAWEATESRLERDASTRYQNLGRLIEREWQALRQLHEEPIKLLRDQAASLTEVCIATANTAQNGVERAEARLAALEADVHRRITDLARDVRGAIAGARASGEGRGFALAGGGGPAWPLEGVMRLHNQLRETEAVSPPPPAADAAPADAAPVDAAPVYPAPVYAAPVYPAPANSPVNDGPPRDPRTPAALLEATALSARVESLERAVNDGKSELHVIAEDAEENRRVGRWWRAMAAVLAFVVVAAGLVAWQLARRAEIAAERSAAAERETQLVTDAAQATVTQARQDAARQIAEARETALKAQTVSNVLAAPDLVRYNLKGTNGSARFSGQFLWSRSRGLVFSASSLPAPPAGMIDQIWLLTSTEPVSAGVFTPDESGRATIATEDTPRVVRPVIGVKVTVEPSGGSELPTGATILSRLPQDES
jgi:hypothetical protein